MTCKWYGYTPVYWKETFVYLEFAALSLKFTAVSLQFVAVAFSTKQCFLEKYHENKSKFGMKVLYDELETVSWRFFHPFARSSENGGRRSGHDRTELHV